MRLATLLVGHSPRSRFTAVLALACVAALLPAAAAQKIGLAGRAYEDPQNGYRIQVPTGWDATPVTPEKAELGQLLWLDPQEEGRAMMVFRLEAKEGSTGGEGKTKAKVKVDITKVLESRRFGISGFDKRIELTDEQVTWKQRTIHHRTWEARKSGLLVDTWTWSLQGYDLCAVYTVATYVKRKTSWMRLYEKSAKSLEPIELEAAGSVEFGASYDELFAWHAAEAERTPGWRALETKSRDFIIKTSSDDEDFIDEVVDRLERSRIIFEEDFPASEDFNAVSVVRICGSEAEFHRYGNTHPGVAGWFNPRSTELVLYDAQAIDRNTSYSVMVHEAFHQYCHFLFGQSEAHRWFDEGHGDYYGGMSFKYKTPRITARMPGGLNRLEGAKAQVSSESFTPLKTHLYYDHRRWQRGGLDSYEQSWSIVYMLRQGAAGKVTRKCWKKEYAEIIPNYVTTLRDGFELAYEELRYEVEAEAKTAGREPTPEELNFTREDIDESRKEQIWKEAMEASWGQIDLEEFEEDWCLYVKKYLKD